jgi:hypothetical protein
MTQKLEVVPQWSAHVAFEDVVPLLLVIVHVERSQPHLVNLPGELAMEEGFTPVNPSQGVLFAVIEWERELVKLGNALAFPIIFLVMMGWLRSVGALMVHHHGGCHGGSSHDG